jgi:hypothetical protein
LGDTFTSKSGRPVFIGSTFHFSCEHELFEILVSFAHSDIMLVNCNMAYGHDISELLKHPMLVHQLFQHFGVFLLVSIGIIPQDSDRRRAHSWIRIAQDGVGANVKYEDTTVSYS